ncbi:arf-GAP with GTPase, ANK repeat and PH domain-containing 1-like [Paramuricea clavata]|uniref:Arf-GAP with GTPase, ANK repeat and PH domain-containing 1-like n=1 Tax=Paramuricea clavata TaxID=317549 RepID=A0A6S7IWE8_PARCT|nr:arf-GAP with GTPase, ANK repeat and PH domain-containing 1-like [Paramuricea clavata]
MFSFKNSKQAKSETNTSRFSIVSSSGQAVKCRKHAKQVVSNKPGVKNISVNSRPGNVSKFGAGLLLACRRFENMMRRSFQLSGSYDVITSWEDLQAAILDSKTPNIDASEKMANRESAVLTSYDTLLSPPSATEGRPTSVSSTVSGSSSRTTGTVSPSSTPSAKPRTARRRTIIFGTKTDKNKDEVDGDQEIGIGRFIPVKQGNLLKRTTNSLNKEWKKKFVVLNDGGILTYYPSVHDYIENVHGKHIYLKQSTVKIPGKTPPIATSLGRNATPKLGSQGANRTNSLEDEILRNNGVQENGSLVISNDFLAQDNGSEIKSALSSTANHIMAAATPTVLKSKPESINRSESIPRKRGRNRRNNKHTKSCELDFSSFPEELQKSLMNAANGTVSQNTQSPRTTPATTPATTPSDGKERKWPTVSSESRVETNTLSGSLKKKGHRRSKSHGTTKMMITNDTKTDTRNGTDEYEFKLVSLDGKSWNFAARSLEEREKWVLEIEQQILTCLQSNFSGRDKMNSNSSSESDLQPIRNVPGNNVCADCGEPNPDWATLNLGALICIACCGFHRNLGTHVSRVRSLDLDEWP